MGRVGVVFAGHHRGHGHRGGIVHPVPRRRHQVRRMGVEEAGPEEEAFPALRVAVQQSTAPLGDPGAVVERLGDLPTPALAIVGAGWRAKVVAPVRQPVLFHPDGVVLADVGLVGVVARQLDVLEAVERPVEPLPEGQVLQLRVGFQRRKLRGAGQRLEVRLAHQCGTHAGRLKILSDRVLRLQQLGAQGVGAVLTRVFSRNDGGAGGRAGRIRAVAPGEQRTLGCEPVEVRGPDLAAQAPEGIPVLLVGGDQQDVLGGGWHCGTGGGKSASCPPRCRTPRGWCRRALGCPYTAVTSSCCCGCWLATG